MKTVTIEIPDDSELIKEGNIYKICQVIPKTWEELAHNIMLDYYELARHDYNITKIKNKTL
jgi:hypothetical protein